MGSRGVGVKGIKRWTKPHVKELACHTQVSLLLSRAVRSAHWEGCSVQYKPGTTNLAAVGWVKTRKGRWVRWMC